MKQWLFLVTLLVAVSGIAQHPLEKFGYVTLSKKFDFLYEKDQYQLNSLAKYLLDKNGFNAYFDSEVPDYRRCEGLRLEVDGKPGFIYTRITLIFKDCNDSEIFRSAEGRSKHKEYRKAYHEALREAFESVAALGIQQRTMPSVEAYVPEATEKTVPAPAAETTETYAADVAAEPRFPTEKYSSYLHKGSSYLLRSTNNGYSLYEETASAADGLLLKGTIAIPDGTTTFFSENGEEYPVVFDNSENFVIHTPSGKLLFERLR